MQQNRKAYWQHTIKYLIVLILIWFVVGVLVPTIFFDQLNDFYLGGFPLGFWFGMQGSQITICLLLFVYVFLMNRLDRKLGFED